VLKNKFITIKIKSEKNFLFFVPQTMECNFMRKNTMCTGTNKQKSKDKKIATRARGTMVSSLNLTRSSQFNVIMTAGI